MQFYNVQNLFLLWLIPVVIIFLYLRVRRRQKLLNAFADSVIMHKISLNHSQTKSKQRIVLFILVLLLLILAVARPQWGNEKKKIKRKGVDILFLLDTSSSMDVQDVKPSRIERAKLQILTFVKRLKGDRIGLVAFAGGSYLYCPLTLDHAAFKIFLDAVHVGFIPEPGTALAQAIKKGINSFQDTSHKYDVMIIFSDGEDHEGGLEELIKRLKLLGIRVYVIGVGTSSGGPIPVINEKGITAGYKADQSGKVIISILKDGNLRSIAESSGGLYYQSTAQDKEIDLIYNHIRNLEQKEFQDKLIIEREDQFQIFLLIAFILLIAESLIGERHAKYRYGA